MFECIAFKITANVKAFMLLGHVIRQPGNRCPLKIYSTSYIQKPNKEQMLSDDSSAGILAS